MGKHLKYSPEMLSEIVKECTTMSDVIRRLGLKMSGGNHSHLHRRVKEYNIDTSHFNAHPPTNFGGGKKQRSPEEILVLRGYGNRQKASTLRRCLVATGRKIVCECGISNMWNGKKLVLEVDHLNGNFLDDRKENLRFVCPNCHSQTPNHSIKK